MISTSNIVEKVFEHQIAREEWRTWLKEHLLPYRELIAYSTCAMMEVETKFRVLDEELSLLHDRNPIESIKTRIKTPESIVEKLVRRNVPLSVENIEEYIKDIAGIRIICSFPSDIYMLADCLLRQDDVTLVERKDYIKHPKGNGYRSLHLIVSVPIFLHDQKRPTLVEVQLRTLCMDCWATLEHEIRYKKGLPQNSGIDAELFRCATLSAELDERMEAVFQKSRESEKNKK